MKRLLAVMIALMFVGVANAQTEEKKGKDGKAVAAEKKADPAAKGKNGKANAETKKKGAHADAKKKPAEPAPAPTAK